MYGKFEVVTSMGWFSRKPSIDAERVEAALRRVADPEIGQDIVTARRVSAIAAEGGVVSFVLETSPAKEAALRRRCEDALRPLPGVKELRIVTTAQKPEDASAAAREGPPPLPGVKRIVAVASGKGGVGKSTTVVNLAHACVRKGLRVGIVDADIYGPSIPRMLGAPGAPELVGNRMLPLAAHGVACLSMGHLVADEAAVVWRGPMLAKTLRQLLRGAAWGEEENPLDALLIDMPPGTGDILLSLAQAVPLSGAVIVTTPQDIAVLDARKALLAFRRLGVPVLGVIENMSAWEDPQTGRRVALFGEGGGARLAAEQDAPLLGRVPFFPEIRETGDAGLRAQSQEVVRAYDAALAELGW